MFYCGIPDKLLVPWLGDKEYVAPADEGEAIGIAIGYFYATGKPATVFCSADGFMNALNPITSHVIPYGIKMKIVISMGRQEAQHIVASGIIEEIIKLIRSKDYKYAKNTVIEIIKKKS